MKLATPRRIVSLLFVLFVFSPPVGAWDWSIRPSGFVPVGESWSWFLGGGGIGIQTTFPLGTSQWEPSLGFDSSWVLTRSPLSVQIWSARAGLDYRIEVAPGLSTTLGGLAGGSWAARTDFSLPTFLPWVGGGTSFRFLLATSLSFETGVRYVNALGLFQGLEVWTGFTLEEGL